MEPVSFTATSAEEAVAQIRAQLGSDAVVLNVRRLPPNGLARFWQKPMIEVLAVKPDAPTPAPTFAPAPAPAAEAAPISEALEEFRQQLAQIKEQVASRAASEPAMPLAEEEEVEPDDGAWRIGALLRKTGLRPLPAQHILDKLRAEHGETPPRSLGEEILCARDALSGAWRRPPSISARSLHVMVGPAGSGKTTYLCKWLTQSVLLGGRTARVWRLDGATANVAECLSVHCEILGVTHERSWEPESATLTEHLGFIDLPGVDWRNPTAVKELASRLKAFDRAHIHLVLNAAYDTSILLSQYRAFAGLPLEDVAVTHLDEETCWGKLWNLVLGTNCCIRHFGAGQNIPGDLWEASPGRIFARQFPGRTAGNRLAKEGSG